MLFIAGISSPRLFMKGSVSRDRYSLDMVLKSKAVFAKVMEPSGNKDLIVKVCVIWKSRFTFCQRQIGNALEVVFQGLPVGTIRLNTGVGVKRH